MLKKKNQISLTNVMNSCASVLDEMVVVRQEKRSINDKYIHLREDMNKRLDAAERVLARMGMDRIVHDGYLYERDGKGGLLVNQVSVLRS